MKKKEPHVEVKETVNILNCCEHFPLENLNFHAHFSFSL